MRGLLLREEDRVLRAQASRRGLRVEVSNEPALPFDLTLMARGAVPWDLVDVGFRALERWEVAAPLDGHLAEEVGGGADQEGTRAVVRDLRVPLYSTDLMLWRRSPGTEALVDVWREEWRGASDPRLAFLRALYLTKPLVLALPRTWLALSTTYAPAPERRRTQGNNRLIHVQIAPGRTVCCRPEEAEHYREMFARAGQRRR